MNLNKKSVVVMVLIAVLFLGLGLVLGGGSTNESNHVGHHHESSIGEVENKEMWTCSMHPQIKLPGSGKCPICGMDLIPLESRSGSDGVDGPNIQLSPYAKKLAKVQTVKVSTERVVGTKEITGTIAWNETLLKTESAWFSGRIEKLNISFTGQYVKKGQVIAGTRAIPLVIKKNIVEKAARIIKETVKLSSGINGSGVIEVKPIRKPKVGVVITGNEVYYKRIEDKFAPVIIKKIKEYDGEIIVKLDEQQNFEQDVYLKDKLTGATYKLSDNEQGVAITLSTGSHLDKYAIVFVESSLSTEDDMLLKNQLGVYVDNMANELVLKNYQNLDIKKVGLYNILGQTIKTWDNLGTDTEYRKGVQLPVAIYVVRITTENGEFVKKIRVD